MNTIELIGSQLSSLATVSNLDTVVTSYVMQHIIWVTGVLELAILGVVIGGIINTLKLMFKKPKQMATWR